MTKAKPVKVKNAKVTVTVPTRCKRTALSINALDSHTRNMARATQITVNGAILSCASFKLTEKGTLILEVIDAFEIVEASKAELK